MTALLLTEHLLKQLKVNRFVVDYDTVEIENDGA